jgi:hypothetical protein
LIIRVQPEMPSSAAAGAAVALAVVALLSGCGATRAVEPPPAALREAPINSLALEQCVGENGPAQCTADGQ